MKQTLEFVLLIALGPCPRTSLEVPTEHLESGGRTTLPGGQRQDLDPSPSGAIYLHFKPDPEQEMGSIHRRHMWGASRHNPSEDALKNKHPTWKKGSEMGKLGGISVAKQPAVCTTRLSLQKSFEDERDPSRFLNCRSGLGLLQTCL